MVADGLAQTVVVVARIVDRQQPPVLGVEHKQQAVEENQRGIPALGEAVARRLSQRINETGKHALKHHPRKVLRDLFLIAAPLGQCRFEKRGRGPSLEREGCAAKQQVKDAEIIFPAGREQVGQIDFKVAAGTRPGAVIVEPPDPAIGQNAPANAPFRRDLGRRQVPEDLPVRRPAPLPAVERKPKAFALCNDRRVAKARTGIALSRGLLLGIGVGEKQVIGNVLVARSALLRQIINPPKQRQNRTNQVLLGRRFVGILGTAQGVETPSNAVPKRGKRLRLSARRLPLGRGLYAVGEKVMGEQLAGHILFSL